jgi:Domain of unknown function (DUF4148)
MQTSKATAVEAPDASHSLLTSKEIIMKIQQHLAVAVFSVVASTAALAGPTADGSSTLTRAEVRQSVIVARDAGQLLPAGDSAEYPRPQAAAASTLERSAVREEVLEARAAGELIPAGEADDTFFARSAPAVSSGLSRADVKQATLRARDAGELIPAGESDDASLARDRVQVQYARMALLARHAAPMVASSN